MTRRVTAGSAGGAGVAGLQAFTTTLTSAPNLDITVDPTGTGRFLVSSPTQIQNQNPLRFADADSSNWVAFRSPTTVTSDVTWTLPAADGTNRQTLTTNGSGTLTWQTPTISVQDNTSDSTTHFVTLTTVTSDTTINTVRRSSTKLTFQPSTGTMSLAGNTASTSTTTGTLIVTGGVGVSGRVTANNIVVNGGTSTMRQINPEANNTYDLGTTALRWRNIYTQDLHLSNGIGDYTVIEGEENLYIVNNKNNKSYKFALIEVDAAEIPPKSKVD
jgi:cytoskeletal protein CcmA (bactofilin family)